MKLRSKKNLQHYFRMYPRGKGNYRGRGGHRRPRAEDCNQCSSRNPHPHHHAQHNINPHRPFHHQQRRVYQQQRNSPQFSPKLIKEEKSPIKTKIIVNLNNSIILLDLQ